jgi:serine protease AprX
MIDSDAVVHPDIMQPTCRIRRYVDATTATEYPLPPSTSVARHWHGTMTACTAAGNGFLSQGLYTSLAPDAHVVLIRTMHEHGRSPTDTIVYALDWLLQHAVEVGIRVVNISVYADELDQSLRHPVTARVEELVAMGIHVIAAAGNDATAPIRPPAAAPGAITVGGIDDHNLVDIEHTTLYHSSFGITELGVQKPDVVAPAMWLAAPMIPGSPVQQEAAALCSMDAMSDAMLRRCAAALLPSTALSCDADAMDIEQLRTDIAARIKAQSIISPQYKMVDGTSFAAPIVASIVAQLLEIDPTLTPSDVKHILMSTATPLTAYPARRQGSGIVNQSLALQTVIARSTAVAVTV